MDEKNPLQICPLPSPAINGKMINKRGRPTIKSIKIFGPQPKSIIAQMLSEIKTKSNIIVEDEPINHNEQIHEFVEANNTDDNTCQTCSYRTNSIKDYKKHLTSHQQFLCDYPGCSYSCKLSSNLIKHKRVHTNEKPYLCDRCSFRSNFVNSLKAHQRTHTAEKPYHCDQCIYKCNSSSNLKKHCHLRHPKIRKYK